jgi:membrane peptidoglycan carboxypeptidase
MPAPYLHRIVRRPVPMPDDMPRRGKKPWNRRRMLRLAGIVVGIGALVGTILVVAAFAWVSRDLPDPNRIKDRSIAVSTKIYARDGKTLLYDVHGDVSRSLVKLADIPKYTQQATIALEDKDFYKHGGVSIRGLIRGVILDSLRGRATGGSTITQQFIKNAILTSERSVTRKLKEIILAYELERKFSKDEILQLYFNEIPYGGTLYGIEAASQSFFGKAVKDLTLAQSALLAAIPQRPTYFSPYGSHTDQLVGRQQYALQQMFEQGYITAAQRDEALKVDVLKQIQPKHEQIKAPHFVLMVKEALADRYGENVLERGGLKVTTTLDWRLQEIAEQAITDYGPKNVKRYGATNMAMSAIDPKTGQIVALVGSRDYFDTAHDGNVNVATRTRNPGSSFKPIVYYTAFARGYSPDTMMFDLRTNFGGTPAYIPNNYDGKEHGPLTMRSTLAGSLNIPAVKTLYLAGIPNVIDTARQLGYTTLTEPDKYGLALALGAGGVTLLEHTNAFATFSQDGVHHPIATILKVEDKNGKVLEQFRDQAEQVLDKAATANLLSVLTDNTARSFIFGSHTPLVLPDRTLFAKTGTTNDWRDGWTMGGTPSLVAGFWAGNNDNSKMAKGADGVLVAAPAWNQFLKEALKGTKREGYPKPPENKATKPVLLGQLTGDVPLSIDRITGLRIPDTCIATYPAGFVTSVVVKEVHDILQYVQKDDPQGDPPSNPAADPQYSRWEEPVQKWAKAKGYTATAPALGDCSLRDPAAAPTVNITTPTLNQTITSTPLPVSVTTGGPRPIARVTYTVDDKVLADVTTGPDFAGSLDLTGFESGFHTLKATATDAVENTNATSLTFNYLIP